MIRAGDILFGKIGTIGIPRYVPVSDRIALSANAILVKPRAVPEYVMALMESRLFVRQIDDQIHTTSQPAFGIQKIRRLLVPRGPAGKRGGGICCGGYALRPPPPQQERGARPGQTPPPQVRPHGGPPHRPRARDATAG